MASTYNDTLVGSLRRQIEALEIDNVTLRSEVNRLFTEHETDVENIRMILIDSVINEDEPKVIANSIADVLGISLLREVTVSIPLTIEATALIPIGFDVADLDITDVGLDSFNTDVEDFSVQSWDVGNIEEM
jgi:hypothetical protein